MYDITGSKVLENNFSNSTELDLSQLAKGSYFLDLTTKNKAIRKKVVIE